MKSVTEWYCKRPDGSWEFNHIEDGWSQSSTPTAKFDSQRKAWSGKEWMHVHQYLDDGNTLRRNGESP